MSEKRLLHDWFSRPLPANVELGERTWLYSAYAFLHYRSNAERGLRVGSDTGLYNGTFFDLGPDAEVQIGNYCALVGAIISTNARVRIGDYALIAHEVVLAESEFAAPGNSTANESTPRDIDIGENVWIGAQSTVFGGAKIGEGAIVGAATVVREDVPAFAIYAGNPGRVVGDCRQSGRRVTARS